MNEKNLLYLLGTCHEEDLITISELIDRIQRGEISPLDLVPKYKPIGPEQQKERKQLGHSLFDSLDPERQEIIIELMKDVLRVQPSEESNMVGGVLAELRGGRSLESVAASLGITPYSLAMYECGCRMPSDRIKARIAEYYGETVSAIFGDEESIGNPALAHLVFSHYQTIDAFANAIGWPVKKASRVVANQTPLRQEEMRQIINHFKVNPEDIAPLFFGTMFA